MSSSTSSSSLGRWLVIFFALVLGVTIPAVAASEWLLRSHVLPVDGFEQLLRKISASSIPNAAFGDSHAAAVGAFDDKDFVNFGLGGANIRQMAERARYYFSKVKPGQVIIEADSHLFSEYRLVAPGTYIPESYTVYRLAVFDERHRRFMFDYWERFVAAGLKPKAVNRTDQLWQIANAAKDAEASKPAEKTQPQSLAPAPSKDDGPPSSITTAPEKSNPPETQKTVEKQVAAVSSDGVAGEKSRAASQARTEFDQFMQTQVGTQTPVIDFQQRDEVRIYIDMIEFLIRRGGKVCLMTYPADRFYRDRADKIPTFALVREFYKKIAADRNIPYVNFWSRFDDPDMFQNGDHLNSNGGRILAKEARQACFGTPAS